MLFLNQLVHRAVLS